MNSSSKLHLNITKRVWRYIKGTIDFSIFYERRKELKFEGYIDSDWTGNFDDGKNTSGYLFSLSLRPFSWNPKKQEIVAQVTTKAEYIAAAFAIQEIISRFRLIQ